MKLFFTCFNQGTATGIYGKNISKDNMSKKILITYRHRLAK